MLYRRWRTEMASPWYVSARDVEYVQVDEKYQSNTDNGKSWASSCRRFQVLQSRHFRLVEPPGCPSPPLIATIFAVFIEVDLASEDPAGATT